MKHYENVIPDTTWERWRREKRGERRCDDMGEMVMREDVMTWERWRREKM